MRLRRGQRKQLGHDLHALAGDAVVERDVVLVLVSVQHDDRLAAGGGRAQPVAVGLAHGGPQRYQRGWPAQPPWGLVPPPGDSGASATIRAQYRSRAVW